MKLFPKKTTLGKDSSETHAHQLKHARCKHSVSAEEALSWQAEEGCVYEKKEDGHRYYLQILPNGASHNYLTTRTTSKKTGRYEEKQDKLPLLKFATFPPGWEDTVFDGEIVAGKTSCDTQHAIAEGRGDFVVFDIIRFHGRDMRELSLRKRLRVIDMLRSEFPKWMREVERVFDDPAGFLRRILDEGGEGIIKKDLDREYCDDAWTKVKALERESVDCVIIGYKPTKSAEWKKKGWIGSVEIGQWVPVTEAEALALNRQHSDPRLHSFKLKKQWWGLLYVGFFSGFDNELRDDISKRQHHYLSQVVEIKAQLRFPKTGKYRHPRFLRLRDDKPMHECTAPRPLELGIKEA